MRSVKKSVMLAGVLASALAGGCASSDEVRMSATDAEVGCGLCRFGDDASSCELMVRIDGAVYPVEGAGIDDFGDAHASDGLCNATRRADVIGRVEDGRFVAESIVLKP